MGIKRRYSVLLAPTVRQPPAVLTPAKIAPDRDGQKRSPCLAVISSTDFLNAVGSISGMFGLAPPNSSATPSGQRRFCLARGRGAQVGSPQSTRSGLLTF